MLEAKGIFKKYGNVEVLKGVEVTIQKSEIVSIVGASGAGKSTLLQILGTLETPDAGTIYFKNYDLSNLDAQKLANVRNKEIGFVFQFHNLLAELTAIENILLPSWISKDNEKLGKERAEKLLELMGLQNRKNHYPSQLSGGEQQRIAVARALINEPSVLFADEPSGNLDTKNADELHQLFFDIREQMGCSFVIVTHNEKFANLADRKLILNDGRFV